MSWNIYRTTYGVRFADEDHDEDEPTPYLVVTKTPAFWAFTEWLTGWICDWSEQLLAVGVHGSHTRSEEFEIAGLPQETVLRYCHWRGWDPFWRDLIDEDDEYAL